MWLGFTTWWRVSNGWIVHYWTNWHGLLMLHIVAATKHKEAFYSGHILTIPKSVISLGKWIKWSRFIQTLDQVRLLLINLTQALMGALEALYLHARLLLYLCHILVNATTHCKASFWVPTNDKQACRWREIDVLKNTNVYELNTKWNNLNA